MTTPHPVRLPDLQAPRFRQPVEGTLNREFLQRLRQAVPATQTVSDQQLKGMIRAVSARFREVAAQERDGCLLPEQLGHLFIGSCPKKVGANVDYKTTQQLQALVQHRNWESDGFLAKIFYTNQNTRYRFKHHELWGFKPCRKFTRAVAAFYPQHWKQFVEVDPARKIRTQFQRQVYREQLQQEAVVNLDTYNEFDL